MSQTKSWLGYMNLCWPEQVRTGGGDILGGGAFVGGLGGESGLGWGWDQPEQPRLNSNLWPQPYTGNSFSGTYLSSPIGLANA